MKGHLDALVALSPIHDALLGEVDAVQEESLLSLYISAISALSESPASVVAEFLAHPLRRSLKRDTSSSRARELALHGLAMLMKKDNFVLKNVVVLAEEAAKSVGDFSRDETVRVAAVELLQVLFEKHVVLDEAFWNKGSGARGLMGWILSQLLDCFAKEQYRALRLRALNVAGLLFSKMCSDVRVAASFFPGYVSALQKIACGDFKQGSALTCASLDCLSHAFVFFFPRKEESGFESVRQLLIQHSLSEATESKEPFLIIVDEKWKEETCSRVASVITKVVRYVHRTYCEVHDEASVRASLVSFCGVLFSDCDRRIIGENLEILVNIVVGYQFDEWPSVVLESCKALGKLRSDVFAERCVQKNLHSLIVSIPRIVRGSVDGEKLSKLRLFSGFCKYLHDSLHLIITSNQSVVCESLIQIATIEDERNKVFAVETELFVSREHAVLSQDQVEQKSIRLPFRLRFCGSLFLSQAVQSVCESIAQNPRALEAVLEGLFERSVEDMTEIMVICAFFARASGSMSLFRRVMEKALLLRETSGLTGAAFFCAVFAKYRPPLQDCVPLMLFCLGSNDVSLAHTAWSALQHIALAFNHQTVHLLIRHNADYIVDKLVKELRLAHASDQLVQLAAVHGILRHSPTNATWLLDDILNEVISLIDASAKKDRQVAVFARVLNEFSQAVKGLPPSKPLPTREKTDSEEGEDDVDESDAFSRQPNAEQKIAARILDRVRHFVPCKVVEAQIDSLSCIGACLEVLGSCRRELLPAIYTVWDPLMRRLEQWSPADSSSLTVARVLHVVQVAARLGTDFLAGEKFERFWKASSRLYKWALLPENRRLDKSSIGGRLIFAFIDCLEEFVKSVPSIGEEANQALSKLKQ